MLVTATSPIPEAEDSIEIPMLYSKTQLIFMVSGVCLFVVVFLEATIQALLM